MNIQQFQYILAVVDLKNFESAAQRCHVTQSTLSTMIGRFEDEIGIKIFNRKSKPVSITSEGESIIKRLRIISNEIESMSNVIQELKGEMVGEFKIGIIPTIAPYLLPLFLAQFARKFPKVNIVVREMTTSQIQEALKMRSLDIGILAIPLLDDDLLENELYTEPFMLYDCRGTNKHNTVSIEDLDYSKLWLLQEGHCLRAQVFKICEMSCQHPKTNVNFEFESGSMDSLLRFTRANQGMTIIPYLASLDLGKEEEKYLVNFNTSVPSRQVGLISHKHFVKKKILKELQFVIQDSIHKIIPQHSDYKSINPL